MYARVYEFILLLLSGLFRGYTCTFKPPQPDYEAEEGKYIMRTARERDRERGVSINVCACVRVHITPYKWFISGV